MNVNDMFPSKYLKGAALKGDVKVTISRVVKESIFSPREKKEVPTFVMYCERATKGVILGPGLAYKIAEILGESDTERWSGKPIILYPEKIKAFGKDTITIRAKGVPKDDGLHEPAQTDPVQPT